MISNDTYSFLGEILDGIAWGQNSTRNRMCVDSSLGEFANRAPSLSGFVALALLVATYFWGRRHHRATCEHIHLMLTAITDCLKANPGTAAFIKGKLDTKLHTDHSCPKLQPSYLDDRETIFMSAKTADALINTNIYCGKCCNCQLLIALAAAYFWLTHYTAACAVAPLGTPLSTCVVARTFVGCGCVPLAPPAF